jgi:hypothetical protein
MYKNITEEIKDKKKYLDENYPFRPVPELNEKKLCIHCDEIIKVGQYKVVLDFDEEYICCPNHPRCDGTIIDWFDIK